MCNELGCLSQTWKKNAGTNTIKFIFRKNNPNDIRETYVRAVCKIRQQKTETCRTRLTAGVNLIYYPGEASTPKLYLTTMKLHVNSAIYDIKSRYMCYSPCLSEFIQPLSYPYGDISIVSFVLDDFFHKFLWDNGYMYMMYSTLSIWMFR